MYKVKNIGPFRTVHCKVKKEGKHFFDISLRALGDCPVGWLWGNDTYNQDFDTNILILGFNVFAFKKFKPGFEIRVLGFWWMWRPK